MTQSHTKLLALINQTNFPVVPFTFDNVEFKDIGAAIGTNYNTHITVKAKEGQGYTKSSSVFYRRINLSAVGPTVQLAVRVGETLTPQQVLSRLNAARGTWLDLEDVAEFTVPVFKLGANPITLSAQADSVGFIGVLVVNLVATA